MMVQICRTRRIGYRPLTHVSCDQETPAMAATHPIGSKFWS